MIARFVARASAVLLSFVAAAGAASAQNYDGAGLVKFGLFMEGVSVDASTTSAPLMGSRTGSADGYAFGASAGYDHIFGRWFLIGAEIDASVGDTSGRIAGFGFTVDYKATARARLGFFVHPSLLAYTTFGGAWLGATLKDTAVTSGGSIDTSKAMVGYTVGGGLEYDMGDFSLFGEYLFADYASWSRPTREAFNVDAESHTFRAGVKFKVGHDHYQGSYRDSVKDPR